MKNLLNYFVVRHLAVRIVFIIDLTIVFCSFLIAALLRFNFDFTKLNDTIAIQALISVGVYATFFYLFKSYKGVVRHASILDIQRIVQASFLAVVFMLLSSFVLLQIFSYTGDLLLSKSILIIQFLLAPFFMATFRLTVKEVYASFLTNYSQLTTRVVIYGAGLSGITTKNTLSSGGRIKVIRFIDDNPRMTGKTLEGIGVLNTLNVLESDFLTEQNITQLIIAHEETAHLHQKQVIEYCLEKNIEVKEVPPFSKWIGGELKARQIKPVKIEDLLGRGEISLDNKKISEDLHGKVVMVTGGAGSIGSEIVRQVLHYGPKEVIIVDQAESPSHDLEVALRKEFEGRSLNIHTIIGDITNVGRMKQLFDAYRPNIVYHAAAYKHVPLMELNAFEAIETNILGTKCIASLAQYYKVEKFVMISTDKAINPSNVMGATKRVAEIYTQMLNLEGGNQTQFIITRFGNVLGSNGSVIPMFRKQIEQGGPVTLTHADITRYFMTISEACNLVLEAGTMGKGGEIFVFDMGQPVKIMDLAKKMIKLSGLKLGQDIDILITCLRPGEKLYEELLTNGENTIPTHHEKIMKAKVRPINVAELMKQMDELSKRLSDHDKTGMVKILKKIVPEFISRNSEFEELDKIRILAS